MVYKTQSQYRVLYLLITPTLCPGEKQRTRHLQANTLGLDLGTVLYVSTCSPSSFRVLQCDPLYGYVLHIRGVGEGISMSQLPGSHSAGWAGRCIRIYKLTYVTAATNRGPGLEAGLAGWLLARGPVDIAVENPVG